MYLLNIKYQSFVQWGLVNFDCSTLWVRDRKKLTDALDITPIFLRTKQGDAGEVQPFYFNILFTKNLEAPSLIFEIGIWVWAAVSGRSRSGSSFAGMASKDSRRTSVKSVFVLSFQKADFNIVL